MDDPVTEFDSAGPTGSAERTLRPVLTGWREGTDPRLRFVSGRGARVVDADGKDTIDLGAQSYNLNLGHFPAHPAFDSGGFSSQFLGVPDVAVALAEELLVLAGDHYAAVHFTTGGGMSNEAALKIARQATGRQKILSLRMSYHGCSQATQQISGWPHLFQAAGRDPDDSFFGEPAHCSRCPWKLDQKNCEIRCAKEIGRHLRDNPDKYAALIAEPMLTSQAIIPPIEYWQILRDACDETGTLLILDEIVNGLGRTGGWFAQKHYGIEADLLSVGKGLNAGIIPLGALLVSKTLTEKVRASGPFLNGQTDENHPMACRAGLWVLQELKKIIGNEYFADQCGLIEKRLREIAAQHDFFCEARGQGMLWGLEIDSKKIPDSQLAFSIKKLKHKMIDSGVLLSSWGRVLIVTPPLVITEQDLNAGFDRMNSALKEWKP